MHFSRALDGNATVPDNECINEWRIFTLSRQREFQTIWNRAWLTADNNRESFRWKYERLFLAPIDIPFAFN